MTHIYFAHTYYLAFLARGRVSTLYPQNKYLHHTLYFPLILIIVMTIEVRK